MTEPLLVGAVAYTPNVVPIWEGIRDYFAGTGPRWTSCCSPTTGGRSRTAGRHIDVAWNTNLAWVRTVAQTDGHVEPWPCATPTPPSRPCSWPGRAAASGSGDLRPRLALGSADSAQAAILPMHFLDRAGPGTDAVDLLRIDSDVGKHGDTGRSELDALRQSWRTCRRRRDGGQHVGRRLVARS